MQHVQWELFPLISTPISPLKFIISNTSIVFVEGQPGQGLQYVMGNLIFGDKILTVRIEERCTRTWVQIFLNGEKTIMTSVMLVLEGSAQYLILCSISISANLNLFFSFCLAYPASIQTSIT